MACHQGETPAKQRTTVQDQKTANASLFFHLGKCQEKQLFFTKTSQCFEQVCSHQTWVIFWASNYLSRENSATKIMFLKPKHQFVFVPKGSFMLSV